MPSRTKKKMQNVPMGKRGASKKSRKFNMPKSQNFKVRSKMKVGKIPTKRKKVPYKGVSVSKMYGD